MANRTDDLETLAALNQGYLLAAEKSDVAWYTEHLSEDYRATNPDGSFVDKADFLARIDILRGMEKNFLAMQMVDEARHMEVFRKRALAGGGGLLHASPASEWALKAILESPTHTQGTLLLNLCAEGMVLSMFRAGEFLAKWRRYQL